MTEPFTPKVKRKRPPRETGRTGTEQDGRKDVKARGGESLKWTSPGHSGVPDQIELYGVDNMIAAASEFGIMMAHEEAVAILAAAIQFTEYKAPKKGPTPNQLRVHARLRARGFTVEVVDFFRSKQ